MKLYGFIRGLLKFITKALLRVTVVGAENIPESGPVLLCPNHVSNWDPLLIFAYSQRQLTFMAKASLFKIPVLAQILKALKVFPVNRNGNDLRAMKTAFSLIKAGNCVGIFPQGKRVMRAEPDSVEIKSGVGMCVYHSKCDVVPVAIVSKKNKINLFSRVYVIFGDVIKYESFNMSEGIKEEFQEASNVIFDRVMKLYKEYKEKM